MKRRLIVLGGLGDLTMRYLAPAIAELAAARRLDPELVVVGAGREELDVVRYRARIREALTVAGAAPAVADRFDWARVDATMPDDLRAVLGADSEPLVYLALPPSVAHRAVAAIDAAGARGCAHVVVEKPFGYDLASAKAFNAAIAEHCDPSRVYRIDHFLGIPGVRTLLALRTANRAFDIRSEAIERVEITWDETLGLEGRASYYDGTGALRDMVQNHLLQVLAMLALEPSDSADPAAVSRARLDVLQHARARPSVVRGQYVAGEISGRRVPAYADEAGVDRTKRTETFVCVEIEVDLPRWRGVPFVLRTGKALAYDRKEVALVFRAASDPFGRAPRNRLVVGLDRELSLALETSVAGSHDGELDPLVPRGGLDSDGLSAYAHVLETTLRGEPGTAVSGEEAEAQWAIVEWILEAFRTGRVPLLEYPAGSDGPCGREARP